MPKTPVQVESVKSNPFITKTISKNLLTPCRQVGLSRKRKTPNNSNSFSEGPSANNSLISVLETTPVSSTSVLSDAQNEVVNLEQIENTKVKKKTRVSKRLITDDGPSQNSNLQNMNKKQCLDEAVEKKKIARILSNDEDDFSKSNEHNNKYMQEVHQRGNSLKNRQELNVVDAVSDKAINTKQTEKNKNNSPKNNENDDFVSVSNNKSNNTNIKSEERETKAKIQATPPTNHEIIDESKSQTILKEVNKQSIHSPANPLISDHDYIKSKSKIKKIKRSLSMKKSSSEDKDQIQDVALKECLITLTPVEISKYTQNKPPSIEDIQNLEKKITEKRKLLDDLKQANIYTKKHDLKELEELTARWKTGCISALNDLLPQLQTHASIDMATLLKNLNIPPEMITLSQDGNLI